MPAKKTLRVDFLPKYMVFIYGFKGSSMEGQSHGALPLFPGEGPFIYTPYISKTSRYLHDFRKPRYYLFITFYWKDRLRQEEGLPG